MTKSSGNVQSAEVTIRVTGGYVMDYFFARISCLVGQSESSCCVSERSFTLLTEVDSL